MIEVSEEFSDLLLNYLLLTFVAKVDVLIRGRHVAIMNQVADLGVHGGGVDDVLCVSIDTICHFGHEAQPDLSCENLIHFAQAASKLLTLKFAWVTRVRLEDNFVKAIAILRAFVDNLYRVEELFTALLDQFV